MSRFSWSSFQVGDSRGDHRTSKCPSGLAVRTRPTEMGVFPDRLVRGTFTEQGDVFGSGVRFVGGHSFTIHRCPFHRLYSSRIRRFPSGSDPPTTANGTSDKVTNTAGTHSHAHDANISRPLR